MLDELNGRESDSASVVGPAMKLNPESIMTKGVLLSKLVEHETSRVVIVSDSTSGQLIADLIAKSRRQIRAPREHSPRPEFRTQHDAFMSIDFQDDITDELLLAQMQQDYNGNWSLEHRFVELVVLNTKEAALHDGMMPTTWCELKARRSQMKS